MTPRLTTRSSNSRQRFPKSSKNSWKTSTKRSTGNWNNSKICSSSWMILFQMTMISSASMQGGRKGGKGTSLFSNWDWRNVSLTLTLHQTVRKHCHHQHRRRGTLFIRYPETREAESQVSLPSRQHIFDSDVDFVGRRQRFSTSDKDSDDDVTEIDPPSPSSAPRRTLPKRSA